MFKSIFQKKIKSIIKENIGVPCDAPFMSCLSVPEENQSTSYMPWSRGTPEFLGL